MSYEPSNIRHAYYDVFVNQAATSQSSYKVVTTLYLFCMEERILYLNYDVTIILHVADKLLSGYYNIVTGL